MAYSKADKFSEEEIEIAKLAKALAHPARIAILKFLASKNSCLCGDIVEELPLSQSTTSQHLKELKLAG
ncbi:MAG: helix-turn-helix transcriptional regulator, partial [Bacteroidetes bacterium]|nr:helix-turn-helix transcriptional regulator [Bacteroidota bacterium]